MILIIQAALVICGLFICDFAYMRSRNDLFSGTYPLIISHYWSFYMRIHYMRVYFWSPYPSHVTRSNCNKNRWKEIMNEIIAEISDTHGLCNERLTASFLDLKGLNVLRTRHQTTRN